jgi:hypothetical protein
VIARRRRATRLLQRLVLAIAFLLLAPRAHAQSPGGAFADSSEFFDDSSLGRWHLTPFGDVRLRRDRAQDIPGRTVDVDRWRLTARGGASWAPSPRFGAELSLRAAAGSDEDAEFPRIDNDAPDTLQLDRASLWVAPWPGGTLHAGQMAFPLRLTELVWDPELRPIGLVAQHRQPVGAFDVMRAGIGAWRRSQLQDDGLVGVAQAGWSFHEGAERSADAFVSYLWFKDTEWLARQDLGRQNRIAGIGDTRHYAERFQLVDLHVEGRAVLASIPVSAGVDLLRNLAPSTETDAARTRLVAGRFGERFGAEVGWAYLRAEREALPGAFASDDWWARTATRGHMPWVTLGWSRWLRLRVFGTFEWRDGVPQRSERLVGELALRWSTS